MAVFALAGEKSRWLLRNASHLVNLFVRHSLAR